MALKEREQGVLRHRGFRDLWLGQAISQLGDALYGLVFLFFVQRVTGSIEMVGYVGALAALPFVLLGPHAGVVADRRDRQKVMMRADLASAILLTAFAIWLAMGGAPPAWTLLALPCALSCINVYFLPAKSASIPRLVPAEDLVKATALSSATQSLMPVFGLALSGTILGAVYALAPTAFFPVACFANAVTFFASAWFIRRLPPLTPEGTRQEPKSAIDDAKAGFQHIFGNHVLKVVLLLGIVMNFVIAPFLVVYVAANAEWFGGSFSKLAWLEFGFMAGMVGGSILAGRFPWKRPGQCYIWSLAAVGLTVAALGFSKSYLFFSLWNIAAGVLIPFAQIPLSTFVQLSVPDSYRGRVSSAFVMSAHGVTPISQGVAGQLLAAVGIVLMFIGMGVGMLATALVGLFDRQFRNATMPKSESAPTDEAATSPVGAAP